jgi:hypothetical protein
MPDVKGEGVSCEDTIVIHTAFGDALIQVSLMKCLSYWNADMGSGSDLFTLDFESLKNIRGYVACVLSLRDHSGARHYLSICMSGLAYSKALCVLDLPQNSHSGSA